MLLTKKFKTLVIVLIVLSVIILPTAFCVSYAKWTGGADSINASVNVGTWETKKFYLKFTSGSQAGTTIELTPDTQGDNPTCTGEFAPAVGDTFQLYYNGALLSIAPKKPNSSSVAFVELDGSDYKVLNVGMGTLGLTTDGAAVSFFAKLSNDANAVNDYLLGILKDGTGNSDKPNSEIRGVATTSGTVLVLPKFDLFGDKTEWEKGVTVYLEKGEQFKIYTDGDWVSLDSFNKTLPSDKSVTLDKNSGIFTVNESGNYRIRGGSTGYEIFHENA